jgi:5-methylcytosine-specific restriction enzyme A
MPFQMTGWHNDKSAEARGYGAAWVRLRAQILKRDKYVCQCSECARLGRVRPANEVDHVVPKAKGGTDDPSNLQAINRDCHKLKTQVDNGVTPKPRIGLDGWPV